MRGDVIISDFATQVTNVNIECARADNNAITPHCIENLLTRKDARLGEKKFQDFKLLVLN